MVLIAVMGCGESVTFPESDARISVTTAAANFHPGDQVGFTIVNNDSQVFLYGLCGALLEVQLGDSWKPRPREPSACPAILYRIEPGHTATSSVLLPASLARTTYRLMISFTPEANVGQPAGYQRSNSFVIN
jgi:hypothetical protein